MCGGGSGGSWFVAGLCVAEKKGSRARRGVRDCLHVEAGEGAGVAALGLIS